jgi:D-alanyl-D-alanine dipeptidase
MKKFFLLPLLLLFVLSCNREIKEIDLSKTLKLIIVTTDGWESTDAKIHRFKKINDKWKKDAAILDAVIGRKGMAWGKGLHKDLKLESLSPYKSKKEGDQKTPAGIFTISDLMGYQNCDSKLFNLPYHQILDSEFGVDDKNSEHYNKVIDSTKIDIKDLKSFERMKRKDGLYKWLFRIDHNSENIKGAGSLIFFHIWRGIGQGTAGCTAVSEDNILKIINWISQETLIIQLPQEVYNEYQEHFPTLPKL